MKSKARGYLNSMTQADSVRFDAAFRRDLPEIRTRSDVFRSNKQALSMSSATLDP
jgi:hypothetical protein